MKKNQFPVQIFFTLLIVPLLCSCISSTSKNTVDDVKNTEIVTSAQKSSIHFKNQDFNFGKVQKGEKVEHIYKFENRGSGILIIKKVKPSCGCTAVILTNNTIPPGETGEIKATLKTASAIGNIKKSITVLSNDPDTPHHNLTISGEIIENISIEPRNINFGSVQADANTNRTASVSIKALSDPDFKIEKIISSKPFITTSVVDENEGEYVINVILKDYHEIGRFSGTITLETNDSKHRSHNISFFGNVEGDITSFPKMIYYGNIVKGKESTQKLYVKINKGGIRITDTKLVPGFLSIKIEERYEEQNNSHCLIEMKLSKNAPIGRLDGLLEIHTNSKQQPVLKIPITGEVKKG
jgi:hypothetical protein